MKDKSEGTKVKRALPFKLTDQEKARKAEAAAELNEQLEAAVKAKKEEVAKHTEKISSLTKRISGHLHAISTGEERREVQCLEVKNFEKDQVEYSFKGEVLETRPMTADDRQLDLKTQKGKKEAKEIPKYQRLAPRYTPKKQDDGDEDIAQVHKLETSRKTASSAVDTKS